RVSMGVLYVASTGIGGVGVHAVGRFARAPGGGLCLGNDGSLRDGGGGAVGVCWLVGRSFSRSVFQSVSRSISALTRIGAEARSDAISFLVASGLYEEDGAEAPSLLG